MVQGINENLPPEQAEALRAGLVERARAVASASGGVLGSGQDLERGGGDDPPA